MTKTEAIANLAKNTRLKAICRNIAKGNLIYKDLFQEVILILLEYDEQKFKEIKCVECFFIKIADTQWNSVTSPFFYKYRKENLTVGGGNIADTDSGFDKEREREYFKLQLSVHNLIENQYWYDREILKYWLHYGSIRAVSKKIGIPKSSIALTVKKVKQIIHEDIARCK